MNVINQASDMMFKNAANLAALAPQLNMPEENYTLNEAVVKISCVVSEYWALSLNINRMAGGKLEVTWRVWDGSTHFSAETMTGAINSCVASHAKAFPQDPLDAAQAVLNGALPVPF